MIGGLFILDNFPYGSSSVQSLDTTCGIILMHLVRKCLHHTWV